MSRRQSFPAAVMIALVVFVACSSEAATLPAVELTKTQLYSGTLSNGTLHAFHIGQNTHTTTMTIYVSVIRTTPFTAESQKIGFCADKSGPTCELDYTIGAKTSFIAEYYSDHYFVIGSNAPLLDVGYAVKWCDKTCVDVCPEDCAARGACNIAAASCTCDAYVPTDISSTTGTSCAIPTSSSDEGLGITIIAIIVVGAGLIVITVIVVTVHGVRKCRKAKQGDPIPSKSSTPAESTNAASQRSSEAEMTPRSRSTDAVTPAELEAGRGTVSSTSSGARSPPPPPSLVRSQDATTPIPAQTMTSTTQHQRQPSQQQQQQQQPAPQKPSSGGVQLAYVHAEPSASGVFLVSYDAPTAYGPGAVLGPYVDPAVNKQQQQATQQQSDAATQPPPPPPRATSSDVPARRLLSSPPPAAAPATATRTRAQPTTATTEPAEESSWGGES